MAWRSCCWWGSCWGQGCAGRKEGGRHLPPAAGAAAAGIVDPADEAHQPLPPPQVRAVPLPQLARPPVGKHPPQTPTPRLLDAEEEPDLGQLGRHAEGAQQGLVVAEVGRRPGQHGEAGDGPAAAGPLVRLGVAAEPLLSLENMDVVAGGGEGPGRAAAGDAAPDHGDPHRRHRSRRPGRRAPARAPQRASAPRQGGIS